VITADLASWSASLRLLLSSPEGVTDRGVGLFDERFIDDDGRHVRSAVAIKAKPRITSRRRTPPIFVAPARKCQR
jgi:hypothetical protein